MAAGRVDSQTIPTPEKRGRGRPPGSGKAATPAKKKGKAHDAEQTKFMVETLLSVAFNVSSIRLGDHWKLSKAEAEALAEPITSILERHELTEKTGAYGDYIALVAAIGMIVVPKVLVHMEVNKEPKGGLRIVQGTTQPTPPAGRTPVEPIRDAKPDDGSRAAVQQRDPISRPSDVKRNLAWLG